MASYINIEQLKVDTNFHHFIENDVLKDLPIAPVKFWKTFSEIIYELSPINAELLQKRDDFQKKINHWHESTQNKHTSFDAYKSFLKTINYLVPEVPKFKITTSNVDIELAKMAGPQLVVPIMNARFALNAVNARWGSLYDALYGSDVISEENNAERTNVYNPCRGKKVVKFAKDFLDKYLPLDAGSHHNVENYAIEDGHLVMYFRDNSHTQLTAPEKFIGFQGNVHCPDTLLFNNNGLHFEINFDKKGLAGQSDLAGINDITLESALTTIMDCEDSIAAVDANDKVIAYKNWLGLNKGELTESINKAGKTFTRSMVADRHYFSPNGQPFSKTGRSLMFVRNVGHLMTNNTILWANNQEVPEGILDAMITSLIALFDILGKGRFRNSVEKSIYIVKPKMHGPEEVAFTDLLFSRVEDALSLPRNTIKMGIMDEERRTSANLKACIYEAKHRVVFINTGFLDRTGDEIHTSMFAGAMARKAEMKDTPWIQAYEKNNVAIGLACGFSGKAQIGKGMWPIPEQMAAMLSTKIAHVESGANTAWVPSPTAATLHALHYHQMNVFDIQKNISPEVSSTLDEILSIPLAKNTDWPQETIENELENNVQGILGYVVRWINSGIGCSKVPDINNVGLMEDRATLRISSQHIANWLKHGICTEKMVIDSLKKMAGVVDEQNKADPSYESMTENLSTSIAFNAARDLIFKGEQQPNGYTEPLLHHYRLLKKQQAN